MDSTSFNSPLPTHQATPASAPKCNPCSSPRGNHRKAPKLSPSQKVLTAIAQLTKPVTNSPSSVASGRDPSLYPNNKNSTSIAMARHGSSATPPETGPFPITTPAKEPSTSKFCNSIRPNLPHSCRPSPPESSNSTFPPRGISARTVAAFPDFAVLRSFPLHFTRYSTDSGLTHATDFHLWHRRCQLPRK